MSTATRSFGESDSSGQHFEENTDAQHDERSVRDLVVGLLRIGAEEHVDQLFDLIIQEAPRLIRARECSIFWKDGRWRKGWGDGEGVPNLEDRFYRRATYKEKKEEVGVQYYLPGEGLTGWVASTGQTLNIRNVTDKLELAGISPDLVWADKYHGYADSQEKAKQSAFLAVPVKVEHEVVGVIRIAKTIKIRGYFNADDQMLLEAFAANVSNIIRKAELQDLRDLWDRLLQDGADLAVSRFDDYLQNVVDAVPKYLGARGCSIFLTESSAVGRRLRLKACTQGAVLRNSVGFATYQFGEGLTGWVAQKCKTLRLKDIGDARELARRGDDLRFKGKHEEYRERYPSFLAAPIHRDGQVLGVIRVVQDAKGKLFSAADERFVERFCGNLAVLMQNAALVEHAASDMPMPLERLHQNRDAIMSLMEDLRLNLKNVFREVNHLSGKHGPVTIKSIPPDPHRVFVGIPFSATAQNVFDYGIKPVLDDLKLDPWKADNFPNIKLIIEKVFEGIQRSGIGIIDISEWNPNVLFELGALYWADRPVILLKHEDARIPADLAGIEYVSYGRFSELRSNLKGMLVPRLKELELGLVAI